MVISTVKDAAQWVGAWKAGACPVRCRWMFEMIARDHAGMAALLSIRSQELAAKQHRDIASYLNSEASVLIRKAA